MTIARNSGQRSSARQEPNSYAWPARKRSAGSDRAAKKYKLTSPLYQRPGYLLWRARHIADSIFTFECRDFGVTASQYVVLSVVKDTPGSDQVSISRIAGLDRFTTALVLSNLIKRKLIVRERSSSDRRRYSLRLSAEGFEILKRILPGAARARARPWMMTLCRTCGARRIAPRKRNRTAMPRPTVPGARAHACREG